MDLEIETKRENPLMDRIEIEFVIHHPGDETPKRDSVRALAADQVGGKKANTVVDHLDSEFGRATTHGYAKIYESQEAVKRVETDHLLERNDITGGGE